LLLIEQQKEDAQCKKKEIDWNKKHTIRTHIFLCRTQVLAGEVFLHHVLIKTRHDDDNEDA
jgi:hypothetical protein